ARLAIERITGIPRDQPGAGSSWHRNEVEGVSEFLDGSPVWPSDRSGAAYRRWINGWDRRRVRLTAERSVDSLRGRAGWHHPPLRRARRPGLGQWLHRARHRVAGPRW